MAAKWADAGSVLRDPRIAHQIVLPLAAQGKDCCADELLPLKAACFGGGLFGQHVPRRLLYRKGIPTFYGLKAMQYRIR